MINRDVQRQRRPQQPQQPFSDAYLRGMPAKRRRVRIQAILTFLLSQRYARKTEEGKYPSKTEEGTYLSNTNLSGMPAKWRKECKENLYRIAQVCAISNILVRQCLCSSLKAILSAENLRCLNKK